MLTFKLSKTECGECVSMYYNGDCFRRIEWNRVKDGIKMNTIVRAVPEINHISVEITHWMDDAKKQYTTTSYAYFPPAILCTYLEENGFKELQIMELTDEDIKQIITVINESRIDSKYPPLNYKDKLRGIPKEVIHFDDKWEKDT